MRNLENSFCKVGLGLLSVVTQFGHKPINGKIFYGLGLLNEPGEILKADSSKTLGYIYNIYNYRPIFPCEKSCCNLDLQEF